MILIINADFTQAQVSDPDPWAEKVLNNYVIAIGGKKAISQIENMVSKFDKNILSKPVQ